MPGILEPFVPSAGDPWDTAKAAHLLRRAGFGPLPNEVADAVTAGPDRTVEALFQFPPDPAPPSFDEIRSAEGRLDATVEGLRRSGNGKINVKAHPELRALFESANRAHRQGILELTAWWLDRMARSPAPLQEKLTLFWHGHFTSSFGDVHDTIAMYHQNALFRRHAAGNFAHLLDGVARDPAMLRYLNNDENRKGHPNENWARELMELFTMGIGHYTEPDIKESARAWTGWTLRDHRRFEDRRVFAFKPQLHDGGMKTFLGQAGAWDGTDIMRIILTNPVTPQWVAGKLVRFFVAPKPDPALVEAMAQQIQASAYELKPALRAMFRSRAFYRPEVMHAQVKSPTEFVVGAVRHLGVTDPDWARLSYAMAGMGQHLFFPPTVAGWHGGTAWMNGGTLFARADTAAALITGKLGTPDLSSLSSVDTIAARLLGQPLPSARRATLARVTAGRPAAETIHLVMSMPEYQAA